MPGGNANKEGKCVIEVTRDIALEKIIDVSSVHGKVIGDGWFGKSGCNHFSNDEKYFVYVAGKLMHMYVFLFSFSFLITHHLSCYCHYSSKGQKDNLLL